MGGLGFIVHDTHEDLPCEIPVRIGKQHDFFFCYDKKMAAFI